MKIICIGRNYAAHARELKNEVPDKPVIFLKPDTALLKDNKPFYIPDWATEVHYETEVVFKIGKNGKYIAEQFADKYISEVGLGIDFTERSLQNELKSKGLPWELSKGFDSSAVVGKFMKISEIKDINNISFYMEKNGEKVQEATTSLMLFPVAKIISFVSQYYTLKTGDLIFSGTPQGVGPVVIGDELKGYMEGLEMFSFKVK
jgi:acylpyruvate hydrolase